jgi:mannose-6-phosphate isomerase-like protein (cupin superfamily)
MQIFDLFDFTGEAYDLKCRPFAPEGAPAGAMVCEVAPGSVSRIHNHAEAEAFLVLEGAGFVTDGTERRPISAGQGVLFPPFVNHVIENADADKPLRMISIYWMGDLAAGAAAAKAAGPRDTLVFSTPPTPNGDLHLGHLSGPYLAADVIRRALAQRGALHHEAAPLAARLLGEPDDRPRVRIRERMIVAGDEGAPDRLEALLRRRRAGREAAAREIRFARIEGGETAQPRRPGRPIGERGRRAPPLRQGEIDPGRALSHRVLP